MQTLADITVVAVEQAVAAPLATRHMADLGARVIKIEPPSGDFARSYDRRARGLSSHFVWVNRSKESVALNLKEEFGNSVLQKLIGISDVFVHNLSARAARGLKLRYEDLAAVNPNLIYGWVSGYGAGGPYSERKAYDLLVQADAGLISVTGSQDNPAKVGIPVADIAAGMYLYSNVLAALIERSRTGKGSHFEVSMLEALAEWLGYPIQYSLYEGDGPRRSGLSHATIAPYGPVKCRDSETLVLAVQNDREWLLFCRIVMDDEALAHDPLYSSNVKRVANMHGLARRIDERFSRLSAAEAVRLLELANIAYSFVRNVADLRYHEQLIARKRWRPVGSSNGTLVGLVSPGVFGDDCPNLGDVPSLGQHTKAVVQELGMTHPALELPDSID